MSSAFADTAPRTQEWRDNLYRDGIVGLPGVFARSWVDELHEDAEAAFAVASGYPGGTANRGPNRYYLAVHPERIRGFVDLLTAPVVSALCSAVLGPDYEIVELGLDIALPGAVDQPWHRDFAMPVETRDEHRLSSLAVNVTTVDVTPDLAPFEIAPGTQWDSGDDFDHGMFPARSATGRYERLASRRYPRRGDISARTGLTIHRGTANRSTRCRPVLILGVVAAGTEVSDVHTLVLSRQYEVQLPEAVRRRLRATVVQQLEPLIQTHDIEGLLMGG
jgi:hypothetical protein